MADPFDSSALFAEFNRPRQASDRILMSKLSTKSPHKDTGGENGAKLGTGNECSSASSDFGESSGSDNEESETRNRHERWDSDGEKPVEIGVDDAGCVMYRPGAKERRVGIKLLQHADYGMDVESESRLGDNGGGEGGELQRLRDMNNMYKKQTRLIDPTRHIAACGEQGGPALQVLFMNHRFARKYRAEIERFVTDLIVGDYDDGAMKPVRTRPYHVCVAEGSGQVKDQETSVNEHRSNTVIGCSRFYPEFTVDHMGFPLVDYIPALSDGWEIPRYEQQFRKVLPVEDDDDEDEDKAAKSGKMQRGCFNCGGQHSLNECQEQRDFQRIAANRRRFQEQATARQPQGTLNKGIADDSKFSAFKPGVYSDALLRGLGLRRGQLPFFTYRMRLLGYPPGYLQEAEVDRSGITMFDKDGLTPKAQGDQGSEDGEMPDADDERVTYNLEKLVEFPGFNVPLPEGVEDEAHVYRCPPMHANHSKEYMRRSLPTTVLKRTHSRAEGATSGAAKRPRMGDDMDLDSPACSRSSVPGRPCTPTLEDLEAQQRLLREQLGDNDSSQDSCLGASARSSPMPPCTPGGATGSLPRAPPETPPVAGSPAVTASTPGTGSFSTPVAASTPVVCLSEDSPLNRSNSASIGKTLGTPVTKVCVEDLPDATQFRIGVQDHIPFENLPDAVGTYDKIKGLISQIRDFKKKPQ